MINKKGMLLLLIITIISVGMHFPHLSKDLMGKHVWRQTQTQSTIISFVKEDHNIFNPRRNERGAGTGIFRMEFPLMQWILAIPYQLFGLKIIVIRICMLLLSLFSVAGMYSLLLKLFKKETLALIGAWAFNFSPAFFYYAINPLPDCFSLCFAIWGLAFFFRWADDNSKLSYLFISCSFLSIATLCKLPFIIYFSVPGLYTLLAIIKDRKNKINRLSLILVGIFALVPLCWYVMVVPTWKNGIVGGMLSNASSNDTIFGFLKYHLLTTLPDLLLNYGSLLFFLAGLFFLFKYRKYKNSLFPVLLIWCATIVAYFLFEINMIEKVHDYYLFPFFPALFILVGYGAYHFFNIHFFTKAFGTLLLLILPFTAYLRTRHSWNPEEPGFNKDLLIYKNELRVAVPPNALCIVGKDISHFIDLYYIDKKGWTFDGDRLSSDTLNSYIQQGARYLYSDTRSVDGDSLLTPFLDTMVMQKGSVKVFRLTVLKKHL